MQDVYPTRLEEGARMFPRKDPVVHGAGHDGPLTTAALERFERDGFLWFEGLFSGHEVIDDLLNEMASLEQTLNRSVRAVSDPASGELRSVFGIHELSEIFDRLTRDPMILGMVRQLLGSDVYIHQSRINDKAGFSGGGFNWHSDFETWHAEDGMPRMRSVSASLMLSDNNEFNGPLMLMPGSHRYFVPCCGRTPDDNWKESLKNQRVGVPNTEALSDLSHECGLVAPKGGVGSLLLFECNTLHASAQNLSPWRRANAFFVYNSIENQLESPFCGSNPRPEFLGSRAGKILP